MGRRSADRATLTCKTLQVLVFILAVRLAMSEAAVEDADETVGESAESLIVGLATGSMSVVVAPWARRSSQRSVGPAEAGVYQVAIARNTREHSVACPRGPRNWGGAA